MELTKKKKTGWSKGAHPVAIPSGFQGEGEKKKKAICYDQRLRRIPLETVAREGLFVKRERIKTTEAGKGGNR